MWKHATEKCRCGEGKKGGIQSKQKVSFSRNALPLLFELLCGTWLDWRVSVLFYCQIRLSKIHGIPFPKAKKVYIKASQVKFFFDWTPSSREESWYPIFRDFSSYPDQPMRTMIKSSLLNWPFVYAISINFQIKVAGRFINFNYSFQVVCS